MTIVVFGPGFCGNRIAEAIRINAVEVLTIGRQPPSDVLERIAGASHIISTVPPADGGDPILERFGPAIDRTGVRLVYLSSTGVYGDTGGAWVDETAPLLGRRADRIAADRAWLVRGAMVLRLPGIYGPGRSVLDRLVEGRAHRVAVPDQVFSRIHVDDIVAATLAALTGDAPPGAYNIADDLPCSQAEVVEWAAVNAGLPCPDAIAMDDPALSSAARAFYAENRRVANGKAKRLLGWRPLYPDYRAGLRALIASTRPSITSTPPAIAVGVQ